jgi:hypothetical protein
VCGTASGLEAFFWDPDDGYTLLGKLPGGGAGHATNAHSINDDGVVVGFGHWGTFPSFPLSPYYAWIWDSMHGIRNLDDLVDAYTKAQPYLLPLFLATAINNRGQILAHSWWNGDVVVLQPYLLGDANCDDLVDAADIKSLLAHIVTFDPNAPVTSYCGWWTADVNQDATLDEKDVTAMWNLLGLSCGDMNGDKVVDQSDLGILLADYGCTAGLGECVGDADADGDTDQSDLGVLLANYGKPCP